MNDKSSAGVLKYFVTKSGLGYETGIYTLEEMKSLPQSARPHIISLGVAASLGYVVLDYKSGKDVNELTTYAGIDVETGKQRKIRGVSEGTIDHPKLINTDSITEKIGNTLRDELQDKKKKSTEDSLRAMIEAKKKKLENTKE